MADLCKPLLEASVALLAYDSSEVPDDESRGLLDKGYISFTKGSEVMRMGPVRHFIQGLEAAPS